MNNAISIIISIIVAASIIGGTLFFTAKNKTEPEKIIKEEQITEIGKLDSTHKHLSILIFINGVPMNLSQNKYMLKDSRVHFEDGNGSIVHVHTTGITLPFFLNTIGIDLQNKCISIDTGDQYCNTASKILRIIVNGNEVTNIESYKLKHDDRILVDYSNDSISQLKFKFNAVPFVPENLLK